MTESSKESMIMKNKGSPHPKKVTDQDKSTNEKSNLGKIQNGVEQKAQDSGRQMAFFGFFNVLRLAN